MLVTKEIHDFNTIETSILRQLAGNHFQCIGKGLNDRLQFAVDRQRIATPDHHRENTHTSEEQYSQPSQWHRRHPQSCYCSHTFWSPSGNLHITLLILFIP